MPDYSSLTELPVELVEVWKLGREIEVQATAKGPDWLEKRLKEWLERVQQLAQKFGPDSFAVSLGIPFGIQVSLTWPAHE
jgi:hypothetical protein